MHPAPDAVAGPAAVAVVLVPSPSGVPDTLTYLVPEDLHGEVRPGACVLVPLGPRQLVGYVLREVPAEGRGLRPLLGVVDSTARLEPETRELLEWLAAEYVCTLSDALPLAIPQRHEAQLEVWLHLDAEWDGKLDGRAGPLTSRSAAAIRRVLAEAGGSLPRTELLGKLPDPNTANVLRRLREEGRLREEPRLLAPRSRALQAKAVELVEPDDGADGSRRLGPRQKEVLAFLEARQEATTPVLQREVCGELEVGSDVVRRLEAAGLVAATRVPLRRRPSLPDVGGAAPRLNPEQQYCVNTLGAAIRSGAHQASLLFGVTGSGKTEVYLHAIEEARRQGRTAILLVPEISLTAQVAAAVRARLGEQIAILHSALSNGQRFDEWERVRRGEADVVVGPRSALFAPLREPGLVVVDEEHDTSYKQSDPAPRYHARDAARQRARLAGASLLLGSATPAIESFYRARSGADTLLQLRERVLGRPLPTVEVIDLRQERRVGPEGLFGERLQEALTQRLAAGEQAILFVNRRGFSAFTLCRDCGHVPTCRRCDVSLTLHRAHAHRLLCHYCAWEQEAPTTCSRCGGTRIRPFGLGTQRVEAAVAELLPHARVARLDRDATRRRGAHAQVIEAFRQRRLDVLVGTQMVTKGFDFPGVTLVGVVTADVALHTPDFRAAERTFQLLTQVSGRAGRGDQAGEVVVQTFAPDHSGIRAAARQDYVRFYEAEIRGREELGYPPFARLARVLASHADEGAAEGRIRAAAALLEPVTRAAGVEILGPSAAPLARLNDRFRWHLILRGADAALRETLAAAVPALRKEVGGLTVDVDPVDVL